MTPATWCPRRIRESTLASVGASRFPQMRMLTSGIAAWLLRQTIPAACWLTCFLDGSARAAVHARAPIGSTLERGLDKDGVLDREVTYGCDAGQIV